MLFRSSSSVGTTLGGRLGGVDGLGLVRQEGSVDVLMDNVTDSGSYVFYSFYSLLINCTVIRKMRSDSLLNSERAQVLVAPPGADPKDYVQSRGGRGGRGSRGRRGRRGGSSTQMEID